jgi:mannosyltransferase
MAGHRRPGSDAREGASCTGKIACAEIARRRGKARCPDSDDSFDLRRCRRDKTGVGTDSSKLGRVWLALAALLLAAGAMRLVNIDAQSLWFDEALSVHIATRPLGEILPAVRKYEQTPPLHALLLHAWIQLAGTTEAAVRGLSVIFSTIAVWIVFRLTHRLAGLAAAFVAGALFAFNPYQIHYAQEARAYALLVLLSAWAADATVRLLSGDASRRTQVEYVIANVLAWYTHVFGALAMLAWNAARAILGRRAAGIALSRWIALQAIVALLAAPYVPTVWSWTNDVVRGFWIEPFGLEMIGIALRDYAGSTVLALVLLAAGVHGLTRLPKAAAAAFVGLIVCVIVLPVVMSQFIRPLFVPRYGIAAAVPLVVLAGVGIAGMSRLWLRIATIALAAGLSVAIAASSVGIYASPDTAWARWTLGPPPAPKSNWRAAGEYLTALMRPGDIAVLNHRRTTMLFDYYVRRSDVRRLGFDGPTAPVTLPLPEGTRVWLILYTTPVPAEEIIEAGGWQVRSDRTFDDIRIVELDQPPVD